MTEEDDTEYQKKNGPTRLLEAVGYHSTVQ